MSLSSRFQGRHSGARPDEPANGGERAHFQLPDLCTLGALLPLILVGELVALVLTLAAGTLPEFDWLRFSLLSTEILWIVLLGAGLLCQLRRWLPRLSAPRGAALCFCLLVLVIALVAAAGQLLTSYFQVNWQQGFWQVLQHVSIGGILAGLVLRYFYLQQQLHQQQQQQMQTRLQARFQSLQSRIRPHFLFNSMNIIASLIETDPQTAERVVEDLSTLFRASLSDAGDLVPLSRELELCERYIHIEQLRLGDRLQVDWHKDLRSDHHPVPSLCLQPLVENAIYHGIQPRVEGGVIRIAVSDAGQRLAITISNPCVAETANLAQRSGNRMALTNLEQRLQARYGNAGTFSVSQAPGFFSVSFSIPCQPVDIPASPTQGALP